MFVALRRKALKAALINMSFAGTVVVSVIAHGVSRGHPAHKAAHLAILMWAQYEVPMIGHQLKGKQLNVVLLQPFPQNSLKCLVVCRSRFCTVPL